MNNTRISLFLLSMYIIVDELIIHIYFMLFLIVHYTTIVSHHRDVGYSCYNVAVCSYSLKNHGSAIRDNC